MKVFEILESFEELPDEPHNSKIVMKDRLQKYYDKIADFKRQNLIDQIFPDTDVQDEDILPGEQYYLATPNPVTRQKIIDVFNRLEQAKAKFRAYKMDNPVDQYAHIEDVIGLKGGWGMGTFAATEEEVLITNLRALVNKGLVLPKSQVLKNKRDKMYDAGQLDDKDITHYYVPPGPQQPKIIKYVEWWRTAKKKLDDELKALRAERERWRGKAKRYSVKLDQKLSETFNDESDEFDLNTRLQVLFQKMEQMRERMQGFIRRGFVARVDPSTDRFSQEDVVPVPDTKTDWVVKPTYIVKVKDPNLRKEILRVFARFYEIRERWDELRKAR